MRKTGLFKDIISKKNGLSITTTLYEAINLFIQNRIIKMKLLTLFETI